MSDLIYIAVDFDATCVDHRYPRVGPDVPDAVPVLRELVRAGRKLVLNTMRGDNELDPSTGETVLAAAVRWFRERELPLFGVNHNPTQDAWTTSPKVYAHRTIDDSAVGCPLREFAGFHRPAVDWVKVRELLVLDGILLGVDNAPALTYTGTACPVPGCMALQFNTPSGLTCENGHGGEELGPMRFPQARGKSVPPPRLERPAPLFLVEGATPPPRRPVLPNSLRANYIPDGATNPPLRY